MMFLQNIRNAWNFPTEITIPTGLEDKRESGLEILDSKALNSNAGRVQKAWNVCRCFVQMGFNSLFLYRYSILDLASYRTSCKNGSFKPLVQVPTFSGNLIFVTDPRIIAEILKRGRNETGPTACFRGGIPTDAARKILGESLISLPDSDHQKLRKTIAPSFSRMEGVEKKLGDIFLDIVQSLGSECEPFAFLPALLIRSVCLCFFNFEGDAEKISRAVDNLLKLSKINTRSASEQKQYQAAQIYLDMCVAEIKRMPECQQMWGRIAPEQLDGFIKLMFFAGQDTTSSFVEYLLWVLGTKQHMQFQEDLFQEWQSSGTDLATFAKHSTLLGNIISEGLRLHPPSFEQSRYSVRDLVIDGQYVIPKNSEFHLMHYQSQRDVQRWGEDTGQFDPGRFSTTKRTPRIYPFSSGKTTCLGKNFTDKFVRIFVMTLISKYHWETLTPIRAVEGEIALKITPSLRIRTKVRGE